MRQIRELGAFCWGSVWKIRGHGAETGRWRAWRGERMRLRATGPRIRRTPEGCAFGPEITEGSHREMARLEG